jgi:predicted transcriptional regulator
MTGVKQQVREVLEQLPDDCSLEDVQYRLYVLETLRKRTEAADRGDFVDQDEVERRLSKWLQK